MKSKSYFSLAAAFVVTASTTLITANSVHSKEPIFSCDTSSAVPSTVVQSPKHGAIKIIEWKTTEFGDKFSPEARCNAVSQKFEKYAHAGTLKYFTIGSVNRQPVICAVASQNAPCNSESMLYTLKKGSNARTILKHLLDVRSGASSSALNETESRIYIDFDKIVEAKAKAGNNANATSNKELTPLF